MSLTSLFSQLILSLVATLQLGMALKDDAHTHTYIYICVCAVYMSGCCIVTFAGHWSSTMYKVCTALWPNARFEYVFHFFTLDWCNMSPQPCNMFACLVFKMCLKKLLLGSYWVQDSSRTVSFPKVASFSRAILHMLKVSLKVLPTLFVLQPLKITCNIIVMIQHRWTNKLVRCYTFKKQCIQYPLNKSIVK
jgi:hypothetical protein